MKFKLSTNTGSCVLTVIFHRHSRRSYSPLSCQLERFYIFGLSSASAPSLIAEVIRSSNMRIKIKFISHHIVIVFALFFIADLQGTVLGGRPLSKAKPDPDNGSATARWLVSQNSWGVLNTISIELGGAPFGNVVSYSDGLPNKGHGIPYFYLTTLDPTARNALKDQRSSLTVSEYPIGTCGKIDPENPTCAKLTLTGKLKLVDGNSQEAENARSALFSKHSEMKDWPKDHNFKIFRLEIEDIFLIDWFGGPKPLTLEEYLHPKMNKAGAASAS